MKRIIKFEAYRLIATNIKTNREVKFDFLKWISKADGMDVKSRTYEYYEEKATLQDMDLVRNIWCLNFTKLRDTNIPSKFDLEGKDGKYEEPIALDDEEYIGENALAMFDNSFGVDYQLIILQRNVHSLGPSGITKYLNKLWNFEEDIMLEIAPILDRNSRLKFKGKDQYRKLSLKLGNMLDNSTIGNSNNPLTKIFTALSGLKGLNAQIVISMGNERNKYLDKDTVDSVIEAMDENKDIVKSGELSYIGDDNKVELADLFSDKVLDLIKIELEKKESITTTKIKNPALEMYIGKMKKRIDLIKRNEVNEEQTG